MIDKSAVAALDERVLGPQHKGLPREAWGKTVRDYLRTGPTLDRMSTPLLTVDRAALDSNVSVMADWARSAGVRLAPHGKTTMAPQVWAQQLDAGAWGITLATPWQVQLARSFGVGRIMLANAIVDPVALAWLAAELDADPSFEFFGWADSVQTVELMDRVLGSSPGERPVNVIVELGAPGGRTGARTIESARAVAAAIHRSARLTLAGVGGYEGSLSHDREPAGLETVRTYLDQLGRLHREIAAEGLYAADAIVTAGGSAYQDVVVEQLANLADEQAEHGVRTSVVVRSGAYVIHDDGFYAGISPLIPGRARAPAAVGDARLGADGFAARAGARAARRGQAGSTVRRGIAGATTDNRRRLRPCSIRPRSPRSTISTPSSACPAAKPTMSRWAPWCDWGSRIRAQRSTNGG